MKVFSFDIGVASIGWAFVEDGELRDCGVRIFTKAENPEDGASLALPRREARGVRRRLDRRKRRLTCIKKLICEEFGLSLEDYLAQDGDLPKAYETSKDTKNPYELRALALKEKLDPKDLARVILHIAKHRGYGNKHAKNQEITIKSASEDKGEDTSAARSESEQEKEKVKKAILKNLEILRDGKYQTWGEYLYYEKIIKKEKVRNKEKDYSHTMRQDEMRRELEIILDKQKSFGLDFKDEFREKILEQAFFQRPLKDFSDKVGECQFYENEKRAPKYSISAMEFVALGRIINTLKNLTSQQGEVFGKDKVQNILQIVLSKGKMTYKQLRKELNLDKNIRFVDSKIDYDDGMDKAEETAFIEFKKFAEFKRALGEEFLKANINSRRNELDKIAIDITNIKDRIALRNKLNEYDFLDEEQKNKLSNIDFSDHINLSLKALQEILPCMRGDGSAECMRDDEAVEKLGLKQNKKVIDKKGFLPPLLEYEPYLPNPVVARGLGEYRKVLNALIKTYGKPHKIHLEYARAAKLSAQERKKREKEQRENYQANQAAELKCKDYELPLTKSNILKVKLFIEQGEYCAYSGKKITREHLQDSTALEIDHIYPYSRSYDNSYQNKVLVFTAQNQNKINKTPFEAFGKDQEKWDTIRALARKLPKPKRKRLLDEKFKDKEKGFLARNLVDTSYIAKLAKEWTESSLEFLPLEASEDTMLVSGERGSKRHVEVVNGTLTATIRHYWGFGQKIRKNNHLHHAQDAIIIAYINAKIIKAFSDFKKHQETNTADFYAKKLSEEEYKKQRAFFKPILASGEDFRAKVLEKINNIFVSKPPRKRARGKLHKETFYSIKGQTKNSKKLLKTYGGEQGVKKAIELGKLRQIGTKIVENSKMVRVDIFTEKGKFYGVPVYTMDFARGVLPNKAVVRGKKEGLKMNENYEFCFSLFKDDLILVQKRNMSDPEFCYYNGFDISNASIGVEKHDGRIDNLTENQKKLFTKAIPKSENDQDKKPKKQEIEAKGKSIGIQTLKVFKKYQVSVLGERRESQRESRPPCKLKNSK